LAEASSNPYPATSMLFPPSVARMLLAWYALATHNGLTKLADAEDPSRRLVNFGAELRCVDAALQMAGIDTTQLSRCAAQSV
jgi:hypothetical protein